MLWPPLALALILSLAVAALAVRVRMLTPDGGGAAVAVGTLVLGFGGWGFATLLGIFFLTSSLLTQWKSAAKTPAGADARAGTARTAGQVLANGAVPAALAVVWALTHAAAVAGALTAAIAAATADTWATEIGLLSRRPPRLITTWRKVRPGASGGVTLLGTAAAVAGAGVIAIGARMVDVPIWIPWATGTAAMAVDSLLGATFEGRWRGVTNDTVNFVATLLAAAGGAGASLL
jgi:uncharacterized protein (TIGR00297 family)